MEMDGIIGELTAAVQQIVVTRLQKTHPADDDFLWFITGEGLKGEIQIESCEGNGPFRIEYDWSKRGWTILNAADVVPMLTSLIHKRRERTQPTTGGTVRR